MQVEGDDRAGRGGIGVLAQDDRRDVVADLAPDQALEHELVHAEVGLVQPVAPHAEPAELP
jgi:hypothetical protein